jgi:hypothetical protein
MRIQSSDCVDQGWSCIWTLIMLLTLWQGRLLYTFTQVTVIGTKSTNLTWPNPNHSAGQKRKSKETGVFDDAHLLRLDNRVQLSDTLSQPISPVRLVLSAAAFELISSARPNTFHLERSTQNRSASQERWWQR